MNHFKKTFSILALAILMLTSGCRKNDVTNADYEISIDETFQVELVSNPTTGYTWKWANEQFTSIVDTINWTYVPDAPELIGSGGKEVWEFRGIQTGIDTIKLEYCQSWDSSSTIESIHLVIKVN